MGESERVASQRSVVTSPKCSSYQDLQHVSRRLALDADAVDLDDLVAGVDQPRAVGGAAVHDSSYHDLARLLVRLDRRALQCGG